MSFVLFLPIFTVLYRLPSLRSCYKQVCSSEQDKWKRWRESNGIGLNSVPMPSLFLLIALKEQLLLIIYEVPLFLFGIFLLVAPHQLYNCIRAMPTRKEKTWTSAAELIATSSFDGIVDVLCIFPLLLIAVIAPWRFPNMLNNIRSRSNGIRRESFHQFIIEDLLNAIIDLPFILALIMSVLCFWRLPYAIEIIKGAKSGREWKRSAVIQVIRGIVDIPLVLILLIVCTMAPWRLVMFKDFILAVKHASNSGHGLSNKIEEIRQLDSNAGIKTDRPSIRRRKIAPTSKEEITTKVEKNVKHALTQPKQQILSDWHIFVCQQLIDSLFDLPFVFVAVFVTIIFPWRAWHVWTPVLSSYKRVYVHHNLSHKRDLIRPSTLISDREASIIWIHRVHFIRMFMVGSLDLFCVTMGVLLIIPSVYRIPSVFLMLYRVAKMGPCHHRDVDGYEKRYFSGGLSFVSPWHRVLRGSATAVLWDIPILIMVILSLIQPLRFAHLIYASWKPSSEVNGRTNKRTTVDWQNRYNAIHQGVCAICDIVCVAQLLVLVGTLWRWHVLSRRMTCYFQHKKLIGSTR